MKQKLLPLLLALSLLVSLAAAGWTAGILP